MSAMKVIDEIKEKGGEMIFLSPFVDCKLWSDMQFVEL
jgi:hypothetical protein